MLQRLVKKRNKDIIWSGLFNVANQPYSSLKCDICIPTNSCIYCLQTELWIWVELHGSAYCVEICISPEPWIWSQLVINWTLLLSVTNLQVIIKNDWYTGYNVILLHFVGLIKRSKYSVSPSHHIYYEIKSFLKTTSNNSGIKAGTTIK